MVFLTINFKFPWSGMSFASAALLLCELSELSSSSSSPLPQKQTRRNVKCETSSECRALQQMATKRRQSLHEKEFRSREKGFTAASIQGEIRVPPSLEHAEINAQFVGTHRSSQGWPRCLCRGTNSPWISLRAASKLCHSITQGPI